MKVRTVTNVYMFKVCMRAICLPAYCSQIHHHVKLDSQSAQALSPSSSLLYIGLAGKLQACTCCKGLG